MERDELDPLVEEIIRSVDGIPPAALEALGRVLMRSAGRGAPSSTSCRTSTMRCGMSARITISRAVRGWRSCECAGLRFDAHEPDDLLERLADIDAPPWASIREAVRYVFASGETASERTPCHNADAAC